VGLSQVTLAQRDAALGPLLDERMADTIGPWVTILEWGREAVRKHRG
jgi:hypothetical protein